jgi:hypothetical protein
MRQADYVLAQKRSRIQTNVGQFQMKLELKAMTKVGILVGVTTMLLTMNVLTTFIVILMHWMGHTYFFPK